ncbi:MAG TPA: nitroreductase family deazaflavin-dependent oxidoreductase [Acidimicrobiales bacterium]|nr:nitroreductase family deazaflavin-dependent oxidoreductase [Acidimicrobiales bacterium]
MTEQRDRLADVGFKLLNLGHKAVFRATGGRFPRSLQGMAAIELRTVGRVSGQVRTTMLTSPVHDEGRVVLVASKYGDDRDPQWYRNLTVNPHVEVVINGETRALRARTASAEEKAVLWPQIVAAYKNYDAYQRKSSRDIPVVICEARP